MNPYVLSFAIVADEIESRVYEEINGRQWYNVFDSMALLVEQFCLDFPEETRHYRREVIETVFEAKARIAYMESGNREISEPETDYLRLEEEYFAEIEAKQLELF